MVDVDNAKRLVFETVFGRGQVRVLFSILDADVILPDIARQCSRDGEHLALDYSRAFPNVQTKVLPDGIFANLTFKDRFHNTFVPWSAIRAIIQAGVVVESWTAEGEFQDVADLFLEPDMKKWVSRDVAEG